MSKPLVQIDDWCIGSHPIYMDAVLYGIPFDHPNPHGMVSNEQVIMTSPIVSVDFDKRIIETKHTLYQLLGNGLSEHSLQELITLQCGLMNAAQCIKKMCQQKEQH